MPDTPLMPTARAVADHLEWVCEPQLGHCPICQNLLAEIDAKEKRLEGLQEALTTISFDSPPDDWEPYDSWGDYQGYGNHDDKRFVDAVDTSNTGDVHYHGISVGRWTAAKTARAALTRLREVQR